MDEVKEIKTHEMGDKAPHREAIDSSNFPKPIEPLPFKKDPIATRGVPQRFVDHADELQLYPMALPAYLPLMGYRVEGDVSHLPINIVRGMPKRTGAIIDSQVDGNILKVQFVRSESFAYSESVRFIKPNSLKYKLQANVHRFYPTFAAFRRQNLPFVSDMPRNEAMVSFELKTKSGEERYPAFRAKEFMAWALQLFAPHNPTMLLASWEPDSDNHATFYRELEQNGGDVVAAAKKTWTHQRFIELGYDLVPKIAVTRADEGLTTASASTIGESPFGYPFTNVRALYKKRGR